MDSHNIIIRINYGKDKKDREMMLSEKLLTDLHVYIKQYETVEYLINGQSGGISYMNLEYVIF